MFDCTLTVHELACSSKYYDLPSCLHFYSVPISLGSVSLLFAWLHLFQGCWKLESLKQSTLKSSYLLMHAVAPPQEKNATFGLWTPFLRETSNQTIVSLNFISWVQDCFMYTSLLPCGSMQCSHFWNPPFPSVKIQLERPTFCLKSSWYWRKTLSKKLKNSAFNGVNARFEKLG